MALINFPETQRAVHLLPIIFNFLFCPVPVRYSTEIFAKFFHLPPPICIQLCPPTAPPPPCTAQCLLSPEEGAKQPHLYLKQTLGGFIICERPCVIGAALWWILARLFWFDVFWLWSGTPAALCSSPGWSISWLMTQQMFAARPGRRFPVLMAAAPRVCAHGREDKDTLEFNYH